MNRGRTIIAAGECGKHIADNIATGAEQVHIGGDQNNSVYVHMGLQSGWGTDTHKIAKFEGGELYLGKGTSRVYHEGYKPTAADVGVTNVGLGGVAVNINDLGINDLNRIKTSGHYYTSNATDLNRPSSAAGPVVHVHGGTGAGYQQYVRDNNLMFRGFTGTTFQPWQTVYHTGNKPTATDVGAFASIGDRLTVDLNTLNDTVNHGVYYQSLDSGATTALNYPTQQAGTLLVTG
ncbi:MAG: pyocin knob domain-containing protein, partial [Fusobacteriaceae bacterium]